MAERQIPFELPDFCPPVCPDFSPYAENSVLYAYDEVCEIAQECKKQKITEIAKAYAADKQIELSVETDGVSDRWVYCDSTRLDMVLNNLLSNAVKYTPEGGKVEVGLKQTECERDGYGCYELLVRDNGIGMTDDFIAEIFEVYGKERSSTIEGLKGTGLGMAISKRLVDAMGGSIEIKSEPEKGSEFIVRLELGIAQEEPEKNTVEEEGDEDTVKLDFRGERILLVDDNPINRQIAKGILKAYGFIIDDASNGREAVNTIEEAEAGYYDVVLMDVRMPVMNGYEATKRIRAMEEGKSDIPIIAMTANTFEEDVKAARDSGMDAHISKPIEIPTMMEILSEILKDRRED